MMVFIIAQDINCNMSIVLELREHFVCIHHTKIDRSSEMSLS